MIGMLLILLGVLALSLVIAIVVMRRGDGLLGAVLGVLPIVLMEIIAQGKINADIQECLTRVCASAGLPPDCKMAEFGCMEWSGLSIAFFWITGVIDVVLYLIGLAIYAGVRAWRKSSS